MVKNLPVSAESTGDAGSIPGRKEPLEEEITHSSILACEIPRTERTHTTNSIRSSSYGFSSAKKQNKKKIKQAKGDVYSGMGLADGLISISYRSQPQFAFMWEASRFTFAI